MAHTAQVRAGNCEPVISPISGKTLVALIYEAIDLGASRTALYHTIKNAECAPALRALIDEQLNLKGK
tara:strand:- start:936 stop:1139 length:204 start_codon:yes stop_codon:yes gene_type:complete